MMPADPRTDPELLTAFRTDRDDRAFAELVRRHGPAVWAACRRRLPDPADAEECFRPRSSCCSAARTASGR